MEANPAFLVEYWPLERVKPYPKNPRKIPDSAVEKIAKSLREFGWQQPLVVDEDGVLIVGHGRRLAALSLGWTEAPVHVAVGLPPSKVRQYRLMDNRSNQEATWDMETLRLEIAEMQQLELSIDLAGFSAAEVADMAPATEGKTYADNSPDVRGEAVTLPGELWYLADHRVLCGDSANPADIARLMGGRVADLVFTDPPYGVDFGAPGAKYNPRSKDWKQIKGDAEAGRPLRDLVRAAVDNVSRVAIPACPIYCWSAPLAAGYDMLQGLIEANVHVQSQLVWRKNVLVMGQADYLWKHEVCWYGWTAGKNHFWAGGRALTSVWEFAKDASTAYKHPAQKPTALAEHAIDNSCPAGGIVVDLFGGSGSTLIAAERRRRVARTMEIDPFYVDVIVRRWQDYTGGTATNGEGRTFAEIEAERKTAAPVEQEAAVNV